MPIEIFLSISANVIIWRTKGLKGKDSFLDEIDSQLLGLIEPKTDELRNKNVLAVNNLSHDGKKYQTITLCIIGKDLTRSATRNTYYRYTIVIANDEFIKIGANPFYLAKKVFTKNVLSYSLISKDELSFNEQKIPYTEIRNTPDIQFLIKNINDKNLLKQYITLLMSENASTLRLPLSLNKKSEIWEWPESYQNYVLSSSEKILQEIYLCIPHVIRPKISFTTNLNNIDTKNFDLAICHGISDNIVSELLNINNCSTQTTVSKKIMDYVDKLFIHYDNIENMDRILIGYEENDNEISEGANKIKKNKNIDKIFINKKIVTALLLVIIILSFFYINQYFDYTKTQNDLSMLKNDQENIMIENDDLENKFNKDKDELLKKFELSEKKKNEKIKELKDQISNLETELENKKDEIMNLNFNKDIIDEYIKDIVKLNKKIAKQKKEIKQLRNKYFRLYKKVDDYINQKNNLKNKKEKFNCEKEYSKFSDSFKK